MTKQHARLLPLAALAIIGVLALASCTPSEQRPVETPSASATPTPTAEATPEPGDPAPTQESVEVPESEEEAIADATRVVGEYNQVVFDAKSNLELGSGYAENFIVPQSQAYSVLEDTVRIFKDEGTRATGDVPTWSTTNELSYSAPLKNAASAQEIEFGTVVLKGCMDTTGRVFETNGEPDERFPAGVSPYEIHLRFVPEVGTWLVSDEIPLGEDEGAHKC